MPRYIDADKLDTRPRGNNSQMTMWYQIKSLIDNAPTADVVEVVRCKDCKYFVENKDAFVKYCKRELKNMNVKCNDFCSYGEKE